MTTNFDKEYLKLVNEEEKRLAVTSLDAFGQRYFPHYMQQGTPDFHKEINALLESDLSRLAIAAPRGHAKSTLVSLIYVTWVALTQHEKFIVIVSNTATQSNILLKSVKDELEHNQLLREDFGEQMGDSWTQDKIILRNGCMIMSRGAGAKVRGLRHGAHRPGLVVVDDLENDVQVRSNDQRGKLKDWYAQALENMLDPVYGRIVAIGTLLHPYALMTELVGDEKWTAYHKLIYRAIMKDDEGNEYALWPSRMPLVKLYQIKLDIGSFAFQCEYQNRPIDEETQVFDPETLNYFKVCNYDSSNYRVFMAIDPAISQKTKADYFVIVTIALERATGRIYVLDIYRKRASIEHHASQFLSRFQKYAPTKIAVETVAFQEILKKVLLDAARQRGLYPSVVGIKNHTDKYMRIQRLQPIAEQGLLYIKKNQQEFVEEFELYPNVEHDDQLDALEMCLRLVQSNRVRMRVL